MSKKVVSVNGKEYECRKSAFARNESPVIISDKMSGKMEGIGSISSSVLDNPICQARQKNPDSICFHCFAENTAKRYSALAKNLSSNTELLTGSVLPLELLPKIGNSLIFRFESFGDCSNVNQARNYFNIARINPRVRFAVWTKNPGFYQQAAKIDGKPENLNIIFSSPMMDTPLNRDVIQRLFPCVDAVFTVWTKAGSQAAGVEITCGSRDCVGCMNCYLENPADVAELVK